MIRSKNILKNCFNCSIFLSILSVLFFTLFMTYSTSLRVVNSVERKVVFSNSEKLGEIDSFDFSSITKKNLPSPDQDTHYIDEQCSLLNDYDKDINSDSGQSNLICDNLSINLDQKILAKKYFIIQLISKEKSPTERTLRSEILLI